MLLLFLEETLEELRQKANAIRQTINEQEFTPEQVAEIKQSYTTWEEKLRDIRSQQQSFATQINSFVIAIDQKAISIDQLITSYHNLLVRLDLFPSTSCIANGVDYRLVLEHVEDASSITTRNIQQYQRQILRNPILTKLEGVLEEYQKALKKAIYEFRQEIVKYEVSDRENWGCWFIGYYFPVYSIINRLTLLSTHFFIELNYIDDM